MACENSRFFLNPYKLLDIEAICYDSLLRQNIFTDTQNSRNHS